MPDRLSDSPGRSYGYVRCPCCGTRKRMYVGDVWKRKVLDASVRIVSPERDGAIVEQVERPQDPRFGISYRDLLAGFTKVDR